MDGAAVARLDAAYQLALAQAFFVDDVVDGDVSTHDVAVLPLLKELELAAAVSAVGWVAACRASHWSSAQALALAGEPQAAGDPRAFRENVLGRSAPVLTYFRALAPAARTDLVDAIEPILTDYLILAQLCDDLADWEQDLLRGRQTWTINQFLARAGLTATSYRHEQFVTVVRGVYLEGGLREALEECASRFSAVRGAIVGLPTDTTKLLRICDHLGGLIIANITRLDRHVHG
jgi:hypothetical protein